MARDEPLLGQALEDLGQALGRDAELLRDALGADHPFVAVRRDEVHRHQSVIGPLGESEHLFEFHLLSSTSLSSASLIRFQPRWSSLYPTFWIGDPYSRSLPPTSMPVNRKDEVLQ
jgi:hypothetical protein